VRQTPASAPTSKAYQSYRYSLHIRISIATLALVASTIAEPPDLRHENKMHNVKNYDPDIHFLNSHDGNATYNRDGPQCAWEACGADLHRCWRSYSPLGNADW
jgi:hypothetical protein